MKRLISIAMKILSYVDCLTGKVIDSSDNAEKEKTNTKDKFFVNRDGSVSINPQNKEVQQAVMENMKKLQAIKKG